MYITAIGGRVIAAGLIAACVTAVSAQTRPDFSGDWVLNRQASTLPPPVSNVESGTLRIEHRDPSFSFARTYVIGGAPRDASFTIRTDGSESSDTGAQGMTTISTLRWQGAALVLAMRIKGPGIEATNDVRYELEDGGRRLRATEQGRSPMGNHDAVWIFDRR
jgi:hypothetical protein